MIGGVPVRQHGFDGDAAPAPASSPRGPRAGSRPHPLVRGALAFRAFVRDGFEGGLERGQGRQQHAELIEGGGQQVALGFGGQQAFAFLGGKPVRRLRGTGAGEASDFLAQDGVAVGAGPESGFRVRIRLIRGRRARGRRAPPARWLGATPALDTVMQPGFRGLFYCLRV